MGVARDSLGSMDRPDRGKGGLRVGTGLSLSSGRTLGEGGMARPSLGARGLPVFWRLPGMGGRSRGAGMLGMGDGVDVLERPSDWQVCQHQRIPIQRQVSTWSSTYLLNNLRTLSGIWMCSSLARIHL